MGNWIHYSSIYPGAPTLSGTAGELIALLQACLIDGTTPQSVTSITRSSTTATVTTAAHGIPVGQTAWRLISGAVQSDYNGTFLVTSTSATTFTYTVANSPTTPATGTILHAIPGAGWTAPYSGTNKKAFYMGAGALARKYLRVNDAAAGTAGAKEALVKGFNTMSDVDTGLNPFPSVVQCALTENSFTWRKSTTANSTTRSWQVFADDRTVLVFMITGDAAGEWKGYYFGEYYTRASGDTTCAMIAGDRTENSNAQGTMAAGESASNSGYGAIGYHKYTCGDAGGFNVSTAVGVAAMPLNVGTQGYCTGVIPFPNPADGGLYLVSPILYRIHSAGVSNAPVGNYRGVYFANHLPSSFNDGDYFQGVGDYAGKSFVVIKTISSPGLAGSCIVVEKSNPEYSS